MKKSIIGLLFAIFNPVSAQLNLDSSLTACYALNANSYEVINNLHGILNNVSSAQDRFSNANKAIEFAGISSSYIELPNSTLLKPNSLTFSAWIKPTPGFSQVSYIVYTRNFNGQSHEAYSLSLETVSSVKKLRVKKNNSITSASIESSSTIGNNSWYHVSFTMDQNYLKLYLNGVLEDSLHAPMSFNYDTTKKVCLGATNEPNNNAAFKGIMDNVRFYNRVLSLTEINQLYLSDPTCIASAIAPVASFSTSALCVNTPVNFFDLSANHPDSWSWTIQGALTTNTLDVNPVYTFSTVGNYTATLISSNAIGSDTASLSFYIHPNPTVLAHSSKTIVCQGDHQNLTASGAFNYLWSTSQTGSNVVVVPYKITTYTVFGTDTNGCKGSGTVLLAVPSDCWRTALTESALEKNSFIIYPNPSNGKFTIESTENNTIYFSIFNLYSAQIQSGELNFLEKKEITIEDVASGIYFIRLNNKIIKIVKE